MLDSADVTLLGVLCLILFVSEIRARAVLRRDASRVQKYKLYKVRDDLIYLVATGKLQESDFVFESFYRAVNHFIKAAKDINLAVFVAAVQEARQKGLDPAEENKWKEIRKALESKDAEVRSAVIAFYHAVLEILVENSFLLRIMVRFKPVGEQLAKFGGWIRRIGIRQTQRRAYRYYRDYARAAGAVA